MYMQKNHLHVLYINRVHWPQIGSIKIILYRIPSWEDIELYSTPFVALYYWQAANESNLWRFDIVQVTSFPMEFDQYLLNTDNDSILITL